MGQEADMARMLRSEYPGAIYHVTARGNERKDIFRVEGDRVRFLEKLGETALAFPVTWRTSTSRYGTTGACARPTNRCFMRLITNQGLTPVSLYVPTDINLTDVGSAYATNHLHFLLAGFIPSRTLPIGANELGILDSPTVSKNFNMQNEFENGWPRSSADWLHSDLREVAYLYVHELFDKFRDLGGLNQP